MDGRTDGWMDGWMLCKSRREGVRGRAQRYGMGGFGCLVVGCLVGLLAWPRCCLVGWSAGWHSVDGCMDGRMLCKWGGRSASPAMQTKPPPRGISSTYSTWGKHGVIAWLFGWHSVDGCMDGRMDGSCAASRFGGVRVSFRRFPSFRTVSTQFREGSEG